jgi:hypothetical protein
VLLIGGINLNGMKKKLEKKNIFKFKIVQSSEEEQQAAGPIL